MKLTKLNNIYEKVKAKKILSENKHQKHYLHGNRNLTKEIFSCKTMETISGTFSTDKKKEFSTTNSILSETLRKER